MTMSFKKAVRKAQKIKMAIQGPSGAGKTFSALRVATALVKRTDPGKEIAFIDTEKSAPMYAPPFDFAIDDDFGEGPKLSYSPKVLIEKLENARKAGIFGAVIVDSFTHFWEGPGGFLAMHAAIGERQKASGKKEDTWGNWKFIDPDYDALWTYIRSYPLHIILCLRSEEKTEKGSDGKVERLGLKAQFRKNWEYEVDIQFAINNQTMVPWKHRLGSVLNDKVFKNPGEEVAEVIANWLSTGAVAVEPSRTESAPPPGPSVAKVAPPPSPTFEDTAPNTEPNPLTEGEPNVAASAPPPPQQTVFDDLLAKIKTAATEPMLQSLRIAVKKAVADKLIDGSGAEYKALSEAYAARNKELKAAA